MTLMILVLLAMQDKPIDIVAASVEKAPALDGVADDDAWKSAAEVKITLWKPHDPNDKKEALLRACRTAGEIHILLVWKDDTKDVRHNPFVWSKEKGAYEEIELPEDVASLGFELEGEFDADMLAGKESRWDVWHWKAARTNPVGCAMDKSHQYSRSNLGGKSKKFMGNDGKPVWIARPEDEGRSATKRVDKPARHEGDEVAQFVAQEPDGSAADVRAKGAWKDKTWTLELSRKLRTGQKDDTQFEAGKSYGFTLAIFDHEEHMDHSVAPAMKLTIK